MSRKSCNAALLFLSWAQLNAQYVLSTFAGGGAPQGLPAIIIGIGAPTSVTKDAAGNLYIVSTQQNRVYKVDVNGMLTTVAGNGEYGYSGDGGPALRATLNYPRGVVVDQSGGIYISDSGNHRIRKITNGTVAGNGTAATSRRYSQVCARATVESDSSISTPPNLQTGCTPSLGWPTTIRDGATASAAATLRFKTRAEWRRRKSQALEPVRTTASKSQRGSYAIEVEELDRIELDLGAISSEPLPVGSTLRDGVFYWQLGPGFLGEYQLRFTRRDGTSVPVHVKVQPKSYPQR